MDKKQKYAKDDIIEIIWKDTHYRSGWLSKEEVDEDIAEEDDFIIHSVGYFLTDSKDCIYIALSHDAQEHRKTGDILAVVKTGVRSIKVLKKIK